MLKIYSEKEIDELLLADSLGSGTQAKIFAMKNGEAYKEYFDAKYIHGKELVDYESLKAGIRNLGHILNLSTIDLKSFCSPTGIAIKDDFIKGITMKRAKGKVFDVNAQSLESLLPYEDAVRKDILELSKHFEMHDVDDSSIYFDSTDGFSLVDLDFYNKTPGNPTINNLFMFYFHILRFIPEVKERIFDRFRKGEDFYRLEVAIEVVSAYLREFGLTEEQIRLRKR